MAIQDMEDIAEVSEPNPTGVRKARKPTVSQAIQLLPKLVEAFAWGGKESLGKISMDIAGIVRETHPRAAQQLERLVEANMRMPRNLNSFQGTSRFAKPRTDLRRLDEVVLMSDVLATLSEVIDEHDKASVLHAFHCTPRHKMLLSGPPGNGKTLIAQVIASSLGIPLLIVDYGLLVDSHLGVTNRNLTDLFQYITYTPVVLFFDEFDSLGTVRGSNNDVTEIRRVTNYLLTQIDDLPPSVFLIAATNDLDSLDKALIRRFDVQLAIEKPNTALRRQCAELELAPAKCNGEDLSCLAQQIADQNDPSLWAVVHRCRAIRRAIALGQRDRIEAIIRAPTISPSIN